MTVSASATALGAIDAIAPPRHLAVCYTVKRINKSAHHGTYNVIQLLLSRRQLQSTGITRACSSPVNYIRINVQLQCKYYKM